MFKGLTRLYWCANSQVGLDLARILESQFFADKFFTFNFFILGGCDSKALVMLRQLGLFYSKYDQWKKI